MQIQLNGALHDVAEGTTLSMLADTLDLGSSRYAIEVNEELIPRSEHSGHALQSGDRVEIVQAIGGG